MKLSKSWTTVTPLSKLIALILFIALPFIGFYLGLHYQQPLSSATISSPFEPNPFSVYISSVSPSSAKIGDTIKIGGMGFTSENYIHINGGYTNDVSSPDGKTLSFTIPNTVEGGCFIPQILASPSDAPRCLAIANIPLKPTPLTLTVANKNGESNTMKLTIVK